MESINPLLIITVLLLFSAFFSGMEIAFVSVEKLYIEVLKKQGSLKTRLLSLFSANQPQFLATTLVGNNIALVLYGIYMATILEPVFESFLPQIISTDIAVLVLQSVFATIVVLITAEFLPKSVFLANSHIFLKWFAIPMGIIYFISFPFVWCILKVSMLFFYLFGLQADDSRPVFGLVDLKNYLEKRTQPTEPKEQVIDEKILSNAIDFKTTRVRECMIPRTEIIALDINEKAEILKESFIQSGHSKIIIYKDIIDDIVGYCHVLELFKKPSDIKSIIKPLPIIIETMLASELLIKFITERKSLALVVDEYGGTSGIISIEDVIEEIFGEIQDEHDKDLLVETKEANNVYTFSARLEVDYLNEKYGLDLPSGEYDTLGGLIFNQYEDIPKVDETIQLQQFDITILSMQENRIDKVRLEKRTENT